MEEQEINLRDVIAILKRRRRLIFIFMGATFVVGLLYAVFATPLYTASVTVRPAAEEMDGLSDLAGRFGSVASLAGINLGGGGSRKEEYVAILQSRELTEKFMEHPDALPQLFPGRWDAEARKWKKSGDGIISRPLRVVSRVLAYLSGDQGWRETRELKPSMWEAYKELTDDILSINEDTVTGTITVQFEFRDPVVAAEWANAYVALANEKIRNREIEEASRALEYLDDQAKNTQVNELRETIYGLIETQMKRIMLANSRPDYAFKIIDKAVVPEDKSHPKRLIIIIASLVFGGVLGVFSALAIEAYQRAVTRNG